MDSNITVKIPTKDWTLKSIPISNQYHATEWGLKFEDGADENDGKFLEKIGGKISIQLLHTLDVVKLGFTSLLNGVRFTTRWYGVVLEITDTYIILEQAESYCEAWGRANELRYLYNK